MSTTTINPQHFSWQLAEDTGIATIMLNRPERKNPLTLESYAELRDTFRELVYIDAIKAVVIHGAGGNFCSGGDVHDIIGPLTRMDMKGLLNFTRMTGEEAERWGFYNQLVAGDQVIETAVAMATRLAKGPTFAHGMTKTLLNQEWNMSIEQIIETEAQAQAICMQTQDFHRAYQAFVAKEKPVFAGN